MSVTFYNGPINPEDIDPISHERLQQGQVVQTACGHLYNRPTLATWVSSGNHNCPVCRAGIVPESLLTTIEKNESFITEYLKATQLKTFLLPAYLGVLAHSASTLEECQMNYGQNLCLGGFAFSCVLYTGVYLYSRKNFPNTTTGQSWDAFSDSMDMARQKIIRWIRG